MAYYDFIEVIPADDGDGYWLVLEDREPGTQFVVDNRWDTREEAEKEGRAFKEEMRLIDAEWQRESAYQAGMGMGCDAYNDVMFG